MSGRVQVGEVFNFRFGWVRADHGYFMAGRVETLQDGVVARVMASGGPRENSQDVSGVRHARSGEEVDEWD